MHFETEELGIEADIQSKMRAIGRQTNSTSIDRSDALFELRMRPRDYDEPKINRNFGINSSLKSNSPLNSTEFGAKELLKKQKSQTRVGHAAKTMTGKTTMQTNSLAPSKPSSAHPSRAPRMLANKASINRMMSSNINQERQIVRNKTTAGALKHIDENDRAMTHTNSGIWGDLGGASTTHSNIISHSRLLGHVARSQESLDASIQTIMQIVDSNKDQPDVMKRQLAAEFTRQNDYAAILTDRVKKLETERALGTINQGSLRPVNEDLTLSASHRISSEAAYNNSGIASVVADDTIMAPGTNNTSSVYRS